jgi:hypothetical protein
LDRSVPLRYIGCKPGYRHSISVVSVDLRGDDTGWADSISTPSAIEITRIPCVAQTVCLCGNRCPLRWYLRTSSRFDCIVPLRCIYSQRSPRTASLRQSLSFEVVSESLDPIRSYRTIEIRKFSAQFEDSVSAVSRGLEGITFRLRRHLVVCHH